MMEKLVLSPAEGKVRIGQAVVGVPESVWRLCQAGVFTINRLFLEFLFFDKRL